MKQIYFFVFSLFYNTSTAIAQQCGPPDCGECGIPVPDSLGVWRCMPNPIPCICVPECGCPGVPCPNGGPEVRGPIDPNELIPPTAVGSRGWVRRDQELPFRVLFENLPNATLAAQRVDISLPLMAHVDYKSFRLGDVGFSDFYYTMPPGRSAFDEVFPVSGQFGVDVHLYTQIDTLTGVIHWIFQSLDPDTGEPPLDIEAGFLTPNIPEVGNGEGFANFTVLPDPTSQTFDEIHFFADIIFDDNEVIQTPSILLTIDADPPVSHVAPIVTSPDEQHMRLYWSGTDVGSGLDNYTLFVSENGAPYKPWLVETDSLSALLPAKMGNTYRILCVARDSVRNVEFKEEHDLEVTFLRWFPDGDNDGYGDNSAEALVASTAPIGFVAGNTDCNDQNPTINPGALEICNSMDDNCNGQIDEGINTYPGANDMCESITISLTANGIATIQPEDILDLSLNTGNCIIDLNSLSLDISTFSCADIGTQTVTLTASDIHGNSGQCTATVTIVDNTAPQALCKNIDAVLDASGQVEVTATDIDNGSSDACSIQSMVVTPSTFTCTQIGVQSVVLAVTDPSDNTSTCNAQVTVQDLFPPVAAPLPTINETCNAILTPPTAMDNCSGVVTATTSDPMVYVEQGTYAVHWIFTDAAGNTSMAIQEVVIEDNQTPEIVCPGNQELFLNTYCQASLPDFTNLAQTTDNCTTTVSQTPVPGFNVTGTGTYTVTLTATDPGGNMDNCSFIITVRDIVAPVISCTPLIEVTSMPGECGATLILPAPNVSDNCGASGVVNSFNNTSNATGSYPVGTTLVIWTATDASGNSSTCQQTVKVNDREAPNVICPGPQTVVMDGNCTGVLPDYKHLVNAFDNCTSPDDLVISQLPAANSALTGFGQLSVQMTVHDAAGNEQQCQFLVNKADQEAPGITCPPSQTLLLVVDCSVALPDYTGDAIVSDNCTSPSISQIPSPGILLLAPGSSTVTLTAIDLGGNTASCSFTVVRTDQNAPVVYCPSDKTIFVNANCEATIPDYRNLANVEDECSTSLEQMPAPGNTLNGVVPVLVTLTAIDAAGNSGSCEFNLIVKDNIAPVITICPPNQDIPLNQACQFVIPALLPEAVAEDNCTPATELTWLQGTEAGTVLPLTHGQIATVTINATDQSGNTGACIVTLTAKDQQSPSITCPPGQDLVLDGQCQSVLPGFFEQTLAQDNCTASQMLQLSQSPAPESIVNGIGTTEVIITATDAAGNSNSCNFTVTKVDDTPPTALCTDITVQLDANGAGSIAAGDLGTGSSDACGPVVISISSGPTNFTCDDSGNQYPVGITVTDQSGNAANCTATVTISDDLHPCCEPPQAICQSYTVNLDQTGNGSLSPAHVDNSSTYDCGLESMSVAPNSFNCSDLGVNTVTLTVTDMEGGISQCTATIAVSDNLAPTPVTAVLPDIVGECSVTVTPPQANDNCAGLVTGTTQDPLTYSSQGTYTIHWTFSDGNGNTSTQTQTVIIDDDVPLDVTCPPSQHVILSGSNCGISLINYLDLAIVTDNCGNSTLSQSPAPGAVLNSTEPMEVTITATDAGGNQASCTFTVEPQDLAAPEAVCQNITVLLDADGLLTVAASQINGGSTDACGIGSLSISPANFTCENLGTNIAMLTVTDVNNNNASCTATVTVADNNAPDAQCQPAVVYLDANGNGSINPDAVNAGSTDACGLQALDLSQSTFTCSHVGVNTVYLTVTDYGANAASCSTFVTVLDQIAPQAKCKNATVAIGSNGSAALAPSAINNNSWDACGIQQFAINPAVFSCTDVGLRTVVLTVTDVHGNTASCSAQVIVEDNMVPSITCPQGIQVLALGTNCTVALPDYAAALLTIGDNCGVTINQLPAAGTLLNVTGLSFVTIAAEDPSANMATCDILINVKDLTPPNASCKDATISLSTTGQATLNTTLINNGSYDACGIQSMMLSQTFFNCSAVGNNVVNLKVTDKNGNTATCESIVTVVDQTPPTVQCQNITKVLDENGQAIISAPEVNHHSNDACGIASMELSRTTFSCADLGANSVVLTVIDLHGNQNSCSAMVSISDQTTPLVFCKNVSVALDASGSVDISASEIANLEDACGITAINISPDQFSCVQVGTNTVTLTASDQSGNSGSCTATVTVVDDTAPTARCKNQTIELEANGSVAIEADLVDDGTIDNCGVQSLSVAPSSFDCSAIGLNTVILTAVDEHNNVATCQAVITVEDNTPPVALCQPINIVLDADGTATLSAGMIDAGSTDACGVESVSIDRSNFICSDIGLQTIWLTVQDIYGNSSKCSANVNVSDSTPPVANCQNTSVVLDATGSGTLTSVAINDGSWDACSSISLHPAQFLFGCVDLGNSTVTLTVNDAHGNSNTCTAQVTVVDNTAPQAICKDITLELGLNGTGIIQPDQVDKDSYDACGVVSKTLSQDTFDCTHIGVQSVLLTVTDAQGNSNSCSATITVNGVDLSIPFAELTYVWPSDMINCNVGDFEVHAGSTNICGSASNTFAVIQIPAMTDPTVVFKTKNKNRLQFRMHQNRVQVEGPSPIQWWNQILQDGGIRVVNGQEVTYEKLESGSPVSNYHFTNDGLLSKVQHTEMVLVCKLENSATGGTVAKDWAELPCDDPDCYANNNFGTNDADCDGITNICDWCANGNDSIDNNLDGLPDCRYPPGFHNIIPAWKCGASKVYVCHTQPDGTVATICIPYTDLASHMVHGDFLGACNNSLCPPQSVGANEERQDIQTNHPPKLKIDQENSPEMLLFPDPTNREINIKFSGLEGQSVELRIVDKMGGLVWQMDLPPVGLENFVKVNLKEIGLPVGVYTVILRSEGATMAKRFIYSH